MSEYGIKVAVDEDEAKHVKEGRVYAYINGTNYSALKLSHNAFCALVNRMAEDLKKLKAELRFDAIAVQGTSGLAVAFPLWMLTGIPVVIVKKDGESCSHGPMVTATGSPWGMELKSYLFVDDLVDSGNTHQRVRDKLHGAKCVGALLYYDAMEWPADLIPKIPELRKIPHAFNENVYKYHVYTGF